MNFNIFTQIYLLKDKLYVLINLCISRVSHMLDIIKNDYADEIPKDLKDT